MKNLIIICSILFTYFNQNQEVKLHGKYKMEFEEKFKEQNCVVTFNDSLYSRKLPNGKTIKGKVTYRKYHISLKDEKTNLQMDFAKMQIGRDTIFFGTKDVSIVDKNKSDIHIDNARLIKLK